jgi:hypothetical protein
LIVDTIIVARDLIKTPNKWTQRAFARDANGDNVDPSDSRAFCFCILGALLKASRITGCSSTLAVSHVKSSLCYDNRSIFAFNDDPLRTHDEVIEVLDYGIEKAKNTLYTKEHTDDK